MSLGLYAKARVFNTAVATATDFLGTDLSPTDARSVFRVTVAMDTATKLSVEIDNGTTQVSDDLNGGADIDAGTLSTFTFGVDGAFTYNFRHDDAGAVNLDYFLVDEVQGGVI
jgi:hypothetical protein